VTALRRGRCALCYLRWAENRPVGFGATCLVCGERRRDHLRLVEFRRCWLSMCHSCATRLFTLQPLPGTLAGLREGLARDRRRTAERRGDEEDLRLTNQERRRGDRRIPLVDVEPLLDDEACIDAEELIIEILDAAELGAEEPTHITPRAAIAAEPTRT
jgi:hypothetical protein